VIAVFKKNLIKPREERVTKLVPSYCFFYQTLTVPLGLKPEEFEDYLTVQMEMLSPFALDQIAWGYVCGNDNKRILLYAAPKKRIQEFITNDNETDFSLIVPDAYPYFHKTQEADTLFFVRTENSALLFEYPEKDTLPGNLHAIPAHPEDTVSVLFHQLKIAYHRFHKDFPTTERLEDYCSEFKQRRLLPSPALNYWVHDSDADPQPLLITEDSILNSDIRDRAWISDRKKQLKRSQILTRLQTATLLLMLILFLGQIVNLVQHIVHSKLESKLAQNAPEQAKIEGRQALIFKLESVSVEVPHPFHRLAAATGLLPPTIYFDEVILDASGMLKIEGNADSITTINNYEKLLSDSGKFVSFDFSGRESRKGNARFLLTLGKLKTSLNPESVTAIGKPTLPENNNNNTRGND